jgi:hypothetical protein
MRHSFKVVNWRVLFYVGDQIFEVIPHTPPSVSTTIARSLVTFIIIIVIIIAKAGPMFVPDGPSFSLNVDKVAQQGPDGIVLGEVVFKPGMKTLVGIGRQGPTLDAVVQLRPKLLTLILIS